MVSNISYSVTQVHNLILLWANTIIWGKNTDRHNTVTCACPINDSVADVFLCLTFTQT